jgi:hypothetical protein
MRPIEHRYKMDLVRKIYIYVLQVRFMLVLSSAKADGIGPTRAAGTSGGSIGPKRAAGTSGGGIGPTRAAGIGGTGVTGSKLGFTRYL